MAWAVGLFLQAAAAAVAAPDVPAAIDFDLRTTTPCPSAGDAIVVCATRRDDERFRLRPLDAGRFEAKPPRAETGIVGDLRGGVGTEHVEFGNGAVSNRVMLKLKLPF